MQNRQKILLNRKRSEEHRARTHRLIALSRLPGATELAEKAQNARNGGSLFGEQRTYTPWPVSCALPGAVASYGRDGG
nr:DUF3847 domain-containing protein [Pseudoflavonifractor sp. 524-17]